MRGRAWAAWACLVAACILALVGTTAGDPWRTLGGALLAVALVLGATLLPWHKVVPPLPPIPDLMQRPGENQRWCSHCGHPAAARGACGRCGSRAKQGRRERRRAGAGGDGALPAGKRR